jgi:hypothetical protein
VIDGKAITGIPREFTRITRQLSLFSSNQLSRMVVLKFTLTPEASSRLHDILTCLAKFSDTVSIEAQKENVHDMSLLLYAFVV